MKIAFITNHPAPYRDDTLKCFNEFEDVKLEVLNVEPEPSNHKEWKFVGNSLNRYLTKPINIPVLGAYNPGVLSMLKKYDLLIIGSYFPATMLASLIYANIKKIPYIICSDAVKDGKKFIKLKKIFVSRFWKSAKAFWVPGKCSKDYFISKGVNENNIYLGYYTNDAKKMKLEIENINDESLFKQYNIEKSKYKFLFVGKLIHTRHIERLVKAVKLLEKQRDDFVCIVIGDGDDGKIINEYCQTGNHIVHINRVAYNQLHSFYNIADAYIHPGEEPYSLATVEGVIAGIPIIATKEVGAVHDYLEDGVNGYIFDGTPEMLAFNMNNLIDGKISNKGITNMQNYVVNDRGCEWAAKQLYVAAKKALK